MQSTASLMFEGFDEDAVHREALWVVTSELPLSPSLRAMYSWTDWRKPLIRTKNKARILILVESHHLNCSAITFLFQRLGRTVLSAIAGKVTLSYMNRGLCIWPNQPWVPGQPVDLDLVTRKLKPVLGLRPELAVTRSQTWAGHAKALGLAAGIKPDTK